MRGKDGLTMWLEGDEEMGSVCSTTLLADVDLVVYPV